MNITKNFTMSNFDQPQEPQEHDIIIALLVLVSLVFLCYWPNIMRAGLELLKP